MGLVLHGQSHRPSGGGDGGVGGGEIRDPYYRLSSFRLTSPIPTVRPRLSVLAVADMEMMTLVSCRSRPISVDQKST